MRQTKSSARLRHPCVETAVAVLLGTPKLSPPPCFLTREIFAPIEAGGWRGCVVDLAEVAFRVRGILFEGGGGDDEAVVDRRWAAACAKKEQPASALCW